MAYTPISQVFITLSTPLLTGEDFSVPLFAATDFSMFEDYATFSSSTEVGETLGTFSKFYKASLGIFASTPRPGYFYAFTRRADAVLTISTGADNVLLALGYKDGGGFDYVEEFTSTETDAGLAAADIANQINASVNFTGNINVTNTVTDELVIETVNYNTWTIIGFGDRITLSTANEESASDLITRIGEAELGAYFMSTDDKTESFIFDAGLALASSESPSLYFVSSDDVDLLVNLAKFNLDRLVLMYQQNDVNTYPECNYLAYNAPYLPGVATWGNLRLSLPAGISQATGRKLSSGEKSVLEENNIAYMEPVGSSAILRGGRTSVGEAIDVMRGRDAMQSDMRVAEINLLASQQGGKLPYNNSGINSICATAEDVLIKYVNRNFINSNYVLKFLPAGSVPLADKQAGIYQSGSFEAELVGSILSSKIYGNLSLQL